MRGWTRLLVILVATAIGATSDQVFQQHAAPGPMPAQRASDNANLTGNLVFWSANSLLQLWPNNRYINGTVTFRQTLL